MSTRPHHIAAAALAQLTTHDLPPVWVWQTRDDQEGNARITGQLLGPGSVDAVFAGLRQAAAALTGPTWTFHRYKHGKHRIRIGIRGTFMGVDVDVWYAITTAQFRESGERILDGDPVATEVGARG
ncbi:hypothetical protein [Nonomuraea aridisoli]|uniref:Uncharacterized protein n=1 Tax=Nonomuraea aridisoli TaxID=2070368 RepID=A0A2W2EDI0_9ACTN|nr:hypothetical protein [Nonomuraea aridisoli]PZG20573.1 hypothetical protein C1J01_08705 [Nonomuraea aridisoli]